jgi:ribonuclease BN (tRNA processing enzyme)
MRLTIVGCSGSFAGPSSPASSYLVQAEYEGRTWNLVLDLGNGALGALQRHIDPLAIDAVVLSHLHSDHCLDLCGLYVVQKYSPLVSPRTRIPVYGPRSTGARMARAYDMTPPDGMHNEFDFRELVDAQAIRIGPFSVTPHLVNHPAEAYGIRVEADGEVLAYTGDTDATANLTPLCHGADLVLSDSAFVEGRDQTRGVHLTARRAGHAATAAGGVRLLVLTHLPPWNDPEVARREAAETWSGRLEVASPGATFELPGGAT